jgi:hypothetical protein
MFEEPAKLKAKILGWVEPPFVPEIDLAFLGVEGKIKIQPKETKNTKGA